MEYATSVETVANYFLRSMEMSNKKIQKMVYYAYVWYIVENNDTNNIKRVLFSEQPEAWIHGPVFPTLYDKYKENGRDNIKYDGAEINLNEKISTFLDEILGVFGNFDGDQLELMTHKEEPWKKARLELKEDQPSSNIITLESIYDYYSSI